MFLKKNDRIEDTKVTPIKPEKILKKIRMRRLATLCAYRPSLLPYLSQPHVCRDYPISTLSDHRHRLVVASWVCVLFLHNIS